MAFDRESAGQGLLTGLNHANGVVRRVHSVWCNFIGEYQIALKLDDDDDLLGVVVLGGRRDDAHCLDTRADPSSHDADFLARDNVLEVALGLMCVQLCISLTGTDSRRSPASLPHSPPW